MSNKSPIEIIKNIWVKTAENDFTINIATTTASKEVRVIVIPVLNAPKIFEFTEEPSKPE
jgi:hypothetical protein